MRSFRLHDPVARMALRWGLTSISGLLAIEAVASWPLRHYLPPNHPMLADFHDSWEQFATRAITACGIFYGMFRAILFHPMLQKKYLQWLKLTPWTPKQPLPLGTVWLSWADALLLAAWATVAQWHFHANPLMPLNGVLVGYLTGSLFNLAATERWEFCLLLWGLGAMLIRGVTAPWIGAGLGLCYLATWRGLRQSLEKFPWEAEEQWKVAIRVWPWNRVGPSDDGTSPATGRVLGVVFWCATLAWIGACAATRIDPAEFGGAAVLHRQVVAFAVLGGFTCAAGRALVYLYGCRAPISLWGRLATGRFIIPGYDRVWIGPIVVAVVSSALAWALVAAALPLPVQVGVYATVVPSLALCLPPRPRVWHLTGQYHAQRGVLAKAIVSGGAASHRAARAA